MASKAAELRELNDTELEHRLGEAKEEMFVTVEYPSEVVVYRTQ